MWPLVSVTVTPSCMVSTAFSRPSIWPLSPGGGRDSARGRRPAVTYDPRVPGLTPPGGARPPGQAGRRVSADPQEPVHCVEESEGGGACGVGVDEAEPHELPPLPDVQGGHLDEHGALAEGVGDRGAGDLELVAGSTDGTPDGVGRGLCGETQALGLGAPALRLPQMRLAVLVE